MNFLISYEDLEFGELIGEGGFGKVYRGKWVYQDVAIKVNNLYS